MYQQIVLIGNLGNDPELRYTPSGVPVASFNLAVKKSWSDSEGGKQEKTTWFRVTAWRKLAEIAGQHLVKGKQVLIVGEMEDARAFTDKEGNSRASLEVTAQTIKFLGTKDAGGNGAQSPAEHSEDSSIPF
jgi:single-strand DNA-binding protein